jgi:predicted amidohydrolase
MDQRRDGPRRATVGTCSMPRPEGATADELLGRYLGAIDRMAARAGEQGLQLDLAVLPECSFDLVVRSVEEVAEALDGRVVTAVARKARQHHTYATAPVQTRREGRVYNSVVLLDRQGEPVGVYDKVFPVMMTDGSLEYGITPGRSFPVFDLDFGRVGIQICWDVAFDDGWQALADQGAELVLHCTDPSSLVAMRGRAWWHEYYIVSSTMAPPALVVDPVGRVVGRTRESGEVLVLSLDLDFRVLHSNCLWGWPEPRRHEYAGRINLDWDDEAKEYLVTSSDPALPVRRFLEVEGLLTGRQRNARNAQLQDEMRGGPPDMPAPRASAAAANAPSALDSSPARAEQ